MRRLLGNLGYDVHGWESGRNVKVNQTMLRNLESQLNRLNDESGQRVSLIGWSLGGVLAREVAKLHADKVRLVVSLGSPLSNDRSFSSVSHIFEMLNGKEPELIEPGRFDALHEAPPVPTTSILTKTDGIVHWHASVQEEGEPAGPLLDDTRGPGEMTLLARSMERVAMSSTELEQVGAMAFAVGIDHRVRHDGDGEVEVGRPRQIGVGEQHRAHQRLDTFGSPGTNHRQGCSTPLVRPIRVVWVGAAGGGVPSSTTCTSPRSVRSAPSRTPSMASA